MNLNEDGIFANYRFQRAGAFVDVGANYGAFLGTFARRGVEVVAFEPHPELFDRLATKYATYAHVTIVQRAISNEEGILPFYTSADHPGIHSLAAFHPTHKPTVEVKVSRLATELTLLGIRSVAALKIDTEGADLPALWGFDFTALRPELVMAEFMDDRSLKYFGYTHHDMAAYMAEQGYEAWVSAWAPIAEYARSGHAVSHRWLGFSSYEPRGVPAWGNLLFVRSEDRVRLHAAVRTTLRNARIRQVARAVPGASVATRLTRRALKRAYARARA